MNLCCSPQIIGSGSRCPNCGYCSCCGRTNGWVQSWPIVRPHWVSPTIYSGSAGSAVQALSGGAQW